jgi:fatty-acyl-CoA synthase
MQALMSSFPLTLPHVFHRAERMFGDKRIGTATATGFERTTYREWARRTRALAGALDDLGISADGRVGTFAWNTARHLELYFAAPCAGRVLHTLNIRLFPEQLAYVVAHAEDEVIFADRSLMKVLAPQLDGFSTVRHIVVMDDGAGEVPDDPRIVDYEELIAGAEAAEFADGDEQRAAAMCYTSGTTGNPKGVVYSHRSTVLHSLATMLADSLGVGESDVILPVVPMFHANAWGLGQAGVMAGADFVMPGPDLSPGAIADLIEHEGVTLAAGVPTIWMAALAHLEGRDLPALRRIVCGGSAVPKALSEAYREKLGMPILQAWGMTEMSPLGTVCQIRSGLAGRSEEELADLRASQGVASPLVELRIAGPEGEELPWDGAARGELQARGPWVAAGYYADERSSESFTEDGWLRTGDVATISPEGYVRLVDRTKDVVKSGGEWISSVELENEIMAHPKVKEAAVIGVPDERWGERPLACVVPEPGSDLDADEVRDFLEGRIAHWWMPERIEFIEEVPKTSVGKFSKKTLRERFAPAAEPRDSVIADATKAG